MPNYKYHHAHFMSPDPLKAAEFYENMLGAKTEEVIKNPDGDVMIHLNLHGSRIWVSSAKSKQPFYGLHHIGLSTDNIEAAVAELKASGVNFIRDIAELRPGVKAAVLAAPDNAVIEFWVDPKDI
jgi:lactoylglutathione lyase